MHRTYTQYLLNPKRWPLLIVLSFGFFLGACSSTDDAVPPAPPTPEEPVVEEQTLLELIQSRDDLSIFAEAIDVANAEDISFENGTEAPTLETLLSEDTPRTVFAPTNAAFNALFEEVGITEEEFLDTTFDTDDLAVDLLQHIVEGAFTSDQLQEGQELPTTLGELVGTPLALTVTLQGGAQVNGIENGAAISTANLTASNGVVHTIDAYLRIPENEE